MLRAAFHVQLAHACVPSTPRTPSLDDKALLLKQFRIYFLQALPEIPRNHLAGLPTETVVEGNAAYDSFAESVAPPPARASTGLVAGLAAGSAVLLLVVASAVALCVLLRRKRHLKQAPAKTVRMRARACVCELCNGMLAMAERHHLVHPLDGDFVPVPVPENSISTVCTLVPFD